MKALLAIFIFGSLTVSAQNIGMHPKEPLSKILENKKYYYSALNEFFKETYVREITKDDLNRLEELLFFTGIELLEDYEPSMLSRFPTSSTRFILGRQAIQKK